jgi:hypothetical protein
MPFERLMEYVAGLGEADWELSLGELGQRVGEPPERLADAVMAVRVMKGERTYISPVQIRAVDNPVVHKAMTDDAGTIVTGFGVDTS